ncbi:hypothetical protein PR202_ga15874 [Eleusine coracana subsp. coracana]|uniref:BHLH domain-containing protein n=1 Tax=Eleusine coracana subsp. coracana TaxID=191504 RepID=A0AAV5CL77_ELECO|nr:hypothetical protein QOZ80_6BG0488040 [Eleusine coracana subsp. coracana]GJM98832.1 hypothetical protein PR202_ga15874 [Eleusine coracana subsp. coracana]
MAGVVPYTSPWLAGLPSRPLPCCGRRGAKKATIKSRRAVCAAATGTPSLKGDAPHLTEESKKSNRNKATPPFHSAPIHHQPRSHNLLASTSSAQPGRAAMWDGVLEHGNHQEAARHQLLPPWLGGAAPFSDPAAVAAAYGAPAGAGPYACADVFGGLGLGHGGVFGFGSFDAVQQQHDQAEGNGNGKQAVVSGLLGRSLQAELGRITAREMMDAKALAASRSHSEAERRRRQRINGHLAKLRSLLPNTTKTDKASLLAEVLDHVKELKWQTSAMMAAVTGDNDEASGGPAQLLPTEADELAVDAAVGGDGRLLVRASLCCEDRPDLIPDIVRALAALRMRARRAEITTLGGRVRSVLLITADDERAGGDGDDDEDDRANDDERVASHRRHECIASVQEALRGVMDRTAASSDTTSSSGGGGSIKRQRMNYAAQEQCSV